MEKTLVAITGASSGIGETFARRLAPDHNLLLIARRKEKLESLAAELTQKHSCRVEIMAADLAIESQTSAVAERLASEPRLILLINNAGFGVKGRFWESPLAAQEQMHKVHVMATVRLTHAALQRLTANNAGGIINVASVSAYVRGQGSVSYCATKSWMKDFTEGLYLDLKGAGSDVRVQALCPGFTYSEFHDAMGADRSQLAGSSMWHSSEFVVTASLEALGRNQLFVIPGWRYRLLAALISKLPSALRLKLEESVGQRRAGQIASAQRDAGQIQGK